MLVEDAAVNGSNAVTIYVWPDGCWCEHDELHEMSHKSDDYVVLTVSDECDGLKIDELVRDYLAQ